MIVFSIGASPPSDISHAHTLLIDVRNASQVDRLAAVVTDGGEDANMPGSQQLLAFFWAREKKSAPFVKQVLTLHPSHPPTAYHRQGTQCRSKLF